MWGVDGGPKKASFFLLNWFNGLGLFWLDLTLPGLTTLQVLQERYGFICSCPRCSLEDQLPERLTTLLHEIQRCGPGPRGV